MPPRKPPSFKPNGGHEPKTGWVYKSGNGAEHKPPSAPDPVKPVQPPVALAVVETPPDAAPIPPSDRHAGAVSLVRRFSLWAAAGGLFPLPVVDIALMASTQIRMVNALAAHYDSPFARDRVKAFVAALAGSLTATGLARGAGGSAIKAIPIVGEAAGMVTLPFFGFAVTYAMGRVFIAHFESGGTLLDFNLDRARAAFRREVGAAAAR